MRTPIAIAVSALLIAGCVAASGVPAPTSPTPTPDPIFATPVSTASSGPIPSPTAVLPDRYPPELIGRLFFLAGSDPHDVTLGRIGLPGRLVLGPANAFLGIDGDRVVTESRSETRAELRLWSFATGLRVGDSIELGTGERFAGIAQSRVLTVSPSGTGTLLRMWSMTTGHEVGQGLEVPSVSEPSIVAAGLYVIVASSIGQDGVDGGVAAVSTVDGSVRTLVGSTTVAGLVAPQRVVMTSASETQLATTVCSTGIDFVGDCQPTAIIDIGTGRLVKTLDLDGRQAVMLDRDWILTADIRASELRDLDGRLVWSTAPLGLGAGIWANQLAADGRLIAEIRSIAGNVEPVLVAVDPMTGRQTMLYGPGTSTDWHAWPSLSTDGIVAIGFDEFSPPCMTTGCGPDDLRVADASALDLATGKLTEHAIHITFAP